mgnify:CR=1 FL=1
MIPGRLVYAVIMVVPTNAWKKNSKRGILEDNVFFSMNRASYGYRIHGSSILKQQ